MNTYSHCKLYTDGSCVNSKGGGKGGWACCLVDEKEDVFLSGYEDNTTNNRMEMTAVIMGLKSFVSTTYTIHTDSQLVINCAQRKWKRNKNIDLWNEYDTVSSGKNIQWIWVKGHSGDKYNELVDSAARLAWAD